MGANDEIRQAVELGAASPAKSWIEDQEPAVLQFVDERTREVRAEYVRSDLFDAVVRAWQVRREGGCDAGLEDEALKGWNVVESDRDRHHRAGGGSVGVTVL